MSSDAFADSASFRDPSGHGYRIDGRILRTVSEHPAPDFEAVRASGVYESLVASGRAIAADILEQGILEPLPQGAGFVLEHPRLPFSQAPQMTAAGCRQT